MRVTLRLLSSLLLAAVLCGCERSEPARVDLPAPSSQGSSGPSRQGPPSNDAVRNAVPPVKEVEWKPAQGPLSEPEKAIVGTWVATVGDYATRSAFMADKVVFGSGEPGKKGDITAIVQAISQDNRVKTNCVWLEFFERRAGIRRECAIVGGQASALDKTDPLTGAKSDLGTTFQWYWDGASKTVRVRFDGDMVVPASDGKELRHLRFRTWVLAFGDKEGEGIKIKESIPEHDFKVPVEYTYEIFVGRFLGK